MTSRRIAAVAVFTLALTVLALAPAASAQEKTIVTTAVDAGTFNTLVAAVQAAGLDTALSGDGPFTVFAPTDDAFAKLPEGTVEGLLADTEALTAILTYHVVSGRLMASDVVAETSLETLNGAALSITAGSGGVEISGANIVTTDIDAGNGVIHVIDTVMMPPSK